jgi:2-polyprenyl-6-methoxyphenol hydroxylase-like FAD-dependent oxidoreductase
MREVPVLIAGGGPVGMTLALELASRGIRNVLVERKPTTTAHPKMDITNGRTMELFRRLGLGSALRAVAVPEDHPFDVSWITTLTGHELHRFRYASPAQLRALSRQRNDGTASLEPPMRVSQVEIEPALKQAIERNPLVEVRFGVAFEAFQQDGEKITARLRAAEDRIETLSCRYLVGCDGGGSIVREQLGVALSGKSRIMPRFMAHFKSDARQILQRWGVTWHYQSNRGTLIAQDDRDTWTLQARFPDGLSPDEVNPSSLIEAFAGTSFDHRIIVANAWTPHLVVADHYGRGRVFLAGDAVHQYIPTGGYGMNTGIADAVDLGWKLAGVLQGFGGPLLLGSYEVERRPVGLRNCEAAEKHNDIRAAIARLYQPMLMEQGAVADEKRAIAGSAIAALGNAENECWGIELGYAYRDSPVIWHEAGNVAPDDPMIYVPTTVPGVRLPSVYLDDGSALFDHLGLWFTLIIFNGAPADAMVEAALERGVPLKVLRLIEPKCARLYQAPAVLVRPDQHVAWRGKVAAEPAAASRILSRVLGWDAR